MTEKEYGDFVLRFEFKLEPNSNNGIGIRAPLEGDAAYNGMEIQVLDDNGKDYKGKLRPAQYHGSIYDVVPAKQGSLKPAGEWNSEEITARLVSGSDTVDLKASLKKKEGGKATVTVSEMGPALAWLKGRSFTEDDPVRTRYVEPDKKGKGPKAVNLVVTG